MGSLFSASGSVYVMFNTTLADQTFTVPSAFLPLLEPGHVAGHPHPEVRTGHRRQARLPTRPRAAASTSSRRIQAELTIGGLLTFTGFIGIKATYDQSGQAYFELTGMVGTNIPLLGSMSGAINLTVYVGAKTGVVGRIQLTRAASAIPGLSLNGQFLFEINTFSSVQTVNTFAIDTRVVERRQRSSAASAGENGSSSMVDQTLGVVAGFRLEMSGDLTIMNVLNVNAHVVLTISAGEVSLLVNGGALLAPFGKRRSPRQRIPDQLRRGSSRASTWRSTTASARPSSLGFSVSAVLAINTTGSTATFGTTQVAPGLPAAPRRLHQLPRLRPRGTASPRSASPSGAFEMSFGVSFDLAGLKFRAARHRGRLQQRLRRCRSRSAHRPMRFIFSLSASGTLRINTTGAARNGVDAGFKLQLTGSVTLLKLFSFNAGFTIEVGKTSGDGHDLRGRRLVPAGVRQPVVLRVHPVGRRSSSTPRASSRSSCRAGCRSAPTSWASAAASRSTVEFLSHEDDGIQWYTLFIGGSASVEVYFDFKLFEISLGIGLDLSVTASSAKPIDGRGAAELPGHGALQGAGLVVLAQRHDPARHGPVPRGALPRQQRYHELHRH